MEYENTEVIESFTEDSSSSSESVSESPEVVSSEDVEILETDDTEAHDSTDEQSEVEEAHEESVEEVETVEEVEVKPSSTIVQYLENEEGDLELTELDVNSLNIMSQAYVESMLAVQTGSNDYYDFIPDNIMSYFQGVMSNHLTNDYRAYHLRHWIQNSQYYSYYDDYYYLFYDFDGESAEQCLEIYKPNGQNDYRFSWGNCEVLNATIMYGTGDNMSDFRKGVSYGQEMAFLLVLAGFLCLYIVNAIFRHLKG